MQQRKPTKQDIIDELQRIQSRDGKVSKKLFTDETGWGQHWFNKYWPATGYQGACEEAGVQRGAIFGVEAKLRINDPELSVRFADAVASIQRVPSLQRFLALAKMHHETILRGGSFADAKRRLIPLYLSMPESERRGQVVDEILRAELQRLELGTKAESVATIAPRSIGRNHVIQVSPKFIAEVCALREQGEEEQRQLAVRFFVEILEYRRKRVRSEHQKNDVCVYNRTNQPWLVVEVKASLKSDKEKRAARRQAFDYAHRKGLRYVVISDGDFYEVYDRCAGERLSYDEMKQGSFQLTSLRSRDSDLLSLLAAER